MAFNPLSQDPLVLVTS